MAIIRSKDKGVEVLKIGRKLQRRDAEKHLGRKVRYGTDFDGIYVGILRAVIGDPGKPWVGYVEITGVLSPAQHWHHTGKVKTKIPYDVGQKVEVKGTKLSITDTEGTDYKKAIELQILNYSRKAKIGGTQGEWFTNCVAALKEVLRKKFRKTP